MRNRGSTRSRAFPYAAPPVGDRRLRPPQRAGRVDGVRDASHYGVVALQQPMPGIFGELGTPQNPAGDDCLNLNVWTPDRGAGGLPVLVWIHGGAFYAGSGIDDVYNGAPSPATASSRSRSTTASACRASGTSATVSRGSTNRATSACSTRSPRSNGCRRTSPRSAAIPANVTIAGESAGGDVRGHADGHATAEGAVPAEPSRRAAPATTASSVPTASMIAGYVLDMLGVAPETSTPSARVSSQTAPGHPGGKVSDELRPDP